MSKIVLDPIGGYVTSWQIEGREVLYQGSEKKRTGIPLLFPNYDRGDPLPRHGFGRLSTWHQISPAEISLSEKDLLPEHLLSYPYQFQAVINVSASDNTLDYQLIVTNSGLQNLPVSPGLHPYWLVSHTDKNKIKTNIKDFSLTPDIDYPLQNKFIADFPDYKLIIEDISQPKLFPIIHYWSQDVSFPDYNFVCFEPLTRTVNGINQNPILITPGETKVFKVRFTVTFNK